MILALRLLFGLVLASMIATVGWAIVQVPLWALPPALSSHPWFIATLVDAYWGFLLFWLWIAYKESSWLSRALWLLAMLALGNIAAALYALIQACKVPANAPIESLLLRSRPS